MRKRGRCLLCVIGKMRVQRVLLCLEPDRLHSSTGEWRASGGVEVSEWRVGGRARRCTRERGGGEWWEGEEGGEEGEWWASGGAREWARGGASRGRDGVPPLSESFLLW